MEEMIKEAPDVGMILDNLETGVSDCQSFVTRTSQNYNDRFQIWPGQSDDGRKWIKKLGYTPSPWDGCADGRVMDLVDGLIQEREAKVMSAWRGSSIQSQALQADDVMRSQLVDVLLKWLLQTHLKLDVEREIKLCFSYRETYGLAFMGVHWREVLNQDLMPLTLKDLVDLAVEGEEQSQTAEILLDPTREEEAIQVLQNLSPGLKTKYAKRAFKELHTDGITEFPVAAVTQSLPEWQALRFGIDIFCPTSVRHDPQRAPWIFTRTWVTETELRETAALSGWDKKVIEEALKHKGESRLNVWGDQATIDEGAIQKNYEDYKDMVELVYYYHRGVAETTGSPATYLTILAPAVDGYLAHGVHRYKHGQYPFAAFMHRWIGPTIVDCRSIPENVKDWWQKIKELQDAQSNFCQLSTIPPLGVPHRRISDRIKFGPGAQFPERTKGEVHFIDRPPDPGFTAVHEEKLQARFDRYTGRESEFVPPNIATLYNQDLVDNFFTELQPCIKMTLQLAQQYLPDTQVVRVTGGKAIPYNITQDEIRGIYDFTIVIAPQDVDLAAMKEKVTLLLQLIQYDKTGVIQRDNLIKECVAILFPSLVDRLIASPETAQERIINEEKMNLALMASGIEPQMHETPDNDAIRLQVLDNEGQKNPELARRFQQPDSAALLKRRVEYLQFKVQQFDKNPTTGKYGVEELQPGTLQEEMS